MKENFEKLGISVALNTALEKMSIVKPTDIQSKVIGEILSGKDVVAQSATGTGKTLAYLLPLLQNINVEKREVQAVVLAPTQELAMQIFRQAELLIKNAELKIGVAALIGGANIARQMDKLKTKPQIIIGSSGRIIELNKKGKLNLKATTMFVLDEVDRMMDDQNLAGVKYVYKLLGTNVQTMIFSATISNKTVSRADLFLNEPITVKLTGSAQVKPDITHSYIKVDFRDKVDMVRKLAQNIGIVRGLVFVNKTDDVKITVSKLQFHKVKVAGLYSGADKMERKKALEDFAKGKIQLLVATDVAARGLDIADVDYVINIDMPEDTMVYVHRTGRTGRAGKNGSAISLVAPKEVIRLTEYGKSIKIKLLAQEFNHGKLEEAIKKKNNKQIVSKNSKSFDKIKKEENKK